MSIEVRSSTIFQEEQGNEDRRLKIPLRGLSLVCLYGAVRVTAGAIRLITDAGAGLAYLSANGTRTNGLLQPSQGVWRTRRYRQFTACQNQAWCLELARGIVREKLDSFMDSLQYLTKHSKATIECQEAQRRLPQWHSKLAIATDLDVIRGIEGISSKEWFAAFGSVFPAGWKFPGRVKRPPTDPVNALMSLGYTMLLRRVEAACAAFGLDLALGALHAYHPGRPSLACDLMEPFRVPVIDRLVLSVLARKLFSLEDFHKPSDDGSVHLTEEAWKRWLTEIESTLHMASEVTLSFQVQIVDRVRKFVESLPAETCSLFQEDAVDDCELLESLDDDKT